MRSSVRKIETPFDPFGPAIEPVETAGQTRILVFENAKAAFGLPHVVAQAIDGGPDVAQVLQHDVVGVSHRYFHSILVIS